MSFNKFKISKIKRMNKENGYCNICKHIINLGDLCYGLKVSDGYIIKMAGYSCESCIKDINKL